MSSRSRRAIRVAAVACSFWALLGIRPCWADRFPPLTSFDSSNPSVMIGGAGAAVSTGFSIATGDVNGDGAPDIIVASPSKNSPAGGKGEFEVVWGTLGSQPLLDLESSSLVSRIIGRPSDEPALARVGCIDINADGRDDIIIGEQRWGSFRGRCYIVFGSEHFPDTLDLASPTLPVLVIVGPAPLAALGRSICGGDIDGDGYSDALLSAYGVDEVIVVRGGASLPSFLDSAIPNEHLIHIHDDLHPGQGLGEALACEDVNRDGYDDILFGCSGNEVSTWNGMAILLHGGPNLPPLVALGNTTLETVIIRNTSAIDFLGSSVAIADFDGDGKKDLIVGADGVDGPAGQNCGAAYVFYSASQLPSSFRVDEESIPRTVIIGSAAQTWWGNSLCPTDFDYDGRHDIAMRCASVDFNSATRDTVAVLYGRETRPDTIWVANDVESSKFASEYFVEHLGRGVAALDVSNDGLQDIILSAYGFDSHRGRLFVVFGPGTTGIDRTHRVQRSLRVMPNPFSEKTTLTFSLRSPTMVRVVIYDVLGRKVAVLSDAALSPGDHALVWGGHDWRGRLVAQGVYFARIETRTGVAMQKLILVR